MDRHSAPIYTGPGRNIESNFPSPTSEPSLHLQISSSNTFVVFSPPFLTPHSLTYITSTLRPSGTFCTSFLPHATSASNTLSRIHYQQASAHLVVGCNSPSAADLTFLPCRIAPCIAIGRPQRIPDRAELIRKSESEKAVANAHRHHLYVLETNHARKR